MSAKLCRVRNVIEMTDFKLALFHSDAHLSEKDPIENCSDPQNTATYSAEHQGQIIHKLPLPSSARNEVELQRCRTTDQSEESPNLELSPGALRQRSGIDCERPVATEDLAQLSGRPVREQSEGGEVCEHDEVQYPKGARLAIIALSLGLALLLFGLDLAILSTAVPSITNDFKTIADIGWYYSAYALTSCSFQFMFGKLYALFSTKWIFMSAVIFFETGSLLSGVAPSSLILILGRAISGLGASGVVSGVFTMVSLSVPLHQRAAFSGFGAAIECLAWAIAPLIGGVLTDRLSWRWCFFINLPLGTITVATVALFFQDPPRAAHAPMTFSQKLRKLDLVSTIVFVPSIIFLLIALQWGGTRYGWDDARIIVLFIVSTVLIGIFVWLQVRNKEDALLPSRIIGQRSIFCGMFFVFCTNTTLAIVQYYMPIYFQAVRSVSATQSGILVLPLIIGAIVSVLVSGYAVSILGYYTPFALLTSIVTPIATGLLTTLTVQESFARLICFQALFGFGVAIGFQAPVVAAQTVLAQKDVPIGIACVQFAQYLGPAIFITVAQTLFAGRLASDLAKLAPGVDTHALENTGLSDLKNLVGSQDLANVLLGYDKAIIQTLYLPLTLSCVGVFGSLGMEWRSFKKKRT